MIRREQHTRANTLKNRAWHKIIAGVGGSLVLLGLAPLALLYWWGFTHNPRPVSMPISVKHGEYASPFFVTERNEDYRIDIEWDAAGAEWKTLNLDWQIVDDGGTLLQQGSYNYRSRGDIAALGQYHSTRRLRQRVIIRNLRDAEGLDSAHPKLEVSLPERSLEMAYGAICSIKLALMVAAPGMLILLFLLITRAIRSNPLAGGLVPRR